jgi:hypothetical protein
MADIEVVAEVMMNCWGETYESALKQVQDYYADGARYNTITAEWEWPNG